MFTGNVMLVPGMEIRTFTVYRPERRETDIGRILRNDEQKIGVIHAILAAAKPEEKERWRQLEHPITHKIIMQYTTPFEILAGDVFVYDLQEYGQDNRPDNRLEQKQRRFYNQAIPYDVGDIGHWNIFYCEERQDI